MPHATRPQIIPVTSVSDAYSTATSAEATAIASAASAEIGFRVRSTRNVIDAARLM